MSLLRVSRSRLPALSRAVTPIKLYSSPSNAEERTLSAGESAIQAKLQEVFQPSRLDVQDVSGGCGTFYAITIASKAFAGKPIVQQHRLVNGAIKEHIEGIHGLQLKTIPDTS